MSLTQAVSHEFGVQPMSDITPIVFVVDDDVSVYESLELLIRCEGWQPRLSRRRKNSSGAREPACRAACYWMFHFRASPVSSYRSASLSNGLTCQSSSSPGTPTCPRRSRR